MDIIHPSKEWFGNVLIRMAQDLGTTSHLRVVNIGLMKKLKELVVKMNSSDKNVPFKDSLIYIGIIHKYIKYYWENIIIPSKPDLIFDHWEFDLWVKDVVWLYFMDNEETKSMSMKINDLYKYYTNVTK